MLFCSRVIIMTLYERIRQLRQEAGMSQDDLAKAMGYSDRSMITKIESGKVDISQKKILAFARVLNTTPGYLMGIDEESSDADLPSETDDFRMFVRDSSQLSPEQFRMARSLLRAAFKATNPELFKGDDDK